MIRKHPEILDSSVQKANLWLKDVEKEIHQVNRVKAYTALRSVLHALRDCLPLAEAVKLAAQMPALIRGIYYDGFKPRAKPLRMTRDGFLTRIGLETRNQPGLAPILAFSAVVRTLYRHLSAGELESITEVLPKEVRALWKEAELKFSTEMREHVKELSRRQADL